MDRDLDRVNESAGLAPMERSVDPSVSRENPLPARDHALFELRGAVYRVSPAEFDLMQDLGRFRTVSVADLERHRYTGESARFKQDLRALRGQGLLQERSVWTGPKRASLQVAVLTARGKELLERHASADSAQRFWAGFVKAREARHDAAVYRMYQAERAHIERLGGRIRRLVLDYELKQRVYSPLAKVKALRPEDYAKRQEEVARQNGLTVVHGKIPLPDLRIEYETAQGDLARVNLELATAHYHGPALQTKAEAGFKFYAVDGSRSRLSRVLEERDITVAILSL